MRRVTKDLTVEREPEVNIILHWIARIYFWLAGWRFEGVMPKDDKFIVIGMPHTSNWDGWNLILASWVVRVRMKWMVKAEFMRWPLLGSFIKWTGGIPIKRDKAYNAVNQTIERFEERDNLVLVLSPEGTRKKTDHWKTGFYWIAKGADVPLLPALMDYGTKTIYFRDLISPHDDLETVIQKLWDHNASATPLFPEKLTEMRLREKDMQRAQDSDLKHIHAESADSSTSTAKKEGDA